MTKPDFDTRDREGRDTDGVPRPAEQPGADEFYAGYTDDGHDDLTEDYPGQRITGPDVCPACEGSGVVPASDRADGTVVVAPCPTCRPTSD